MATRNPPPQEYESDDDSYEVLDLTEYARRHHWWNRVFGHSSGPMVEKYSNILFLLHFTGSLTAALLYLGQLVLNLADVVDLIQCQWVKREKYRREELIILELNHCVFSLCRPNLVRSPIIGRSLLGKARDRTGH
ncbi:hypothetical protein FD755_016026 [Muntiacus reevesi]|uniref:Uncharacterized protein n=1 Tax=Muntiacus reevesi TaxID=9886 RepID=A0A5N3XG63_MUNRE|nr:hypothetical protein FD755_016026 [Muntiacus reevesi]